MRELLGARLGIEPAAVQFRYGPHGKPELDGHAASSALKFNLSHSGDLALIGFAFGRELGVDIEFWRRLGDEEALARRHFAPSELADYLALRPEARTEGFFNGWTRKEAFIKAVGRGLSLPLSSFEVELRPGRAAALRSWQRGNDDSREWSLAALAPSGRCAAAVVVEGDRGHTIEVKRTCT